MKTSMYDNEEVTKEFIKPLVMAEGLGVQEPPQDERIFNRRMPDGSFRPIEDFFNAAAE